MELKEIIKQRHSVRQFDGRAIDEETRLQLAEKVEELNTKGHLHMQVFYDEPICFSSALAHYGKFSGCTDYVVLAGPKSDDLDEKCGYYGEELVLFAQSLGLNSCWVALTHGKTKAVIEPDEKLAIVIALGYGQNQGYPHKSKSVDELSLCDGDMPAWFKEGVEAAMLAPTAMNQQKFKFILKDGEVHGTPGRGFYTKIDFGIARYHFESVSGHTVTKA